MIKAILKKLNGGASDPGKVSERLALLLEDRAETARSIDALQRERKQALLEDASDQVLDAIERKIDRATVKLEKISLAEAPLREQLEAARVEAKQAALVRHFGILESAYQALRDSVNEAENCQVALFALRERAAKEIGEHTVAIRFPIVAFAGILGAGGHVTQWTKSTDAAIAAARASIHRQPAQQPAATPKIAVQPPKVSSSLQHAVALETLGGRVDLAQERGPLFAPKAPDDNAVLAPDEVRALVLRAGYQGTDGRNSHVGRRIRLPRSIATEAAAVGAIEILPGG